ncbi:hypothetical protein MTO96_006572 [Rhipicephalus appendiculatus]
MMDQTNIALVTFEGLRVPRFASSAFMEQSYAATPHHLRQQVCKTCLKLGHRADYCPTPDVTACEQCGTDNPMPSHPCSPRCESCGRVMPPLTRRYLLGKPATSTASTDHQQQQASANSNGKAAPREVGTSGGSWGRVPHSSIPPPPPPTFTPQHVLPLSSPEHQCYFQSG